MKIRNTVLTTTLLTLVTAILVVFSIQPAHAFDFDDPANIMSAINQANGSVQSTVRTTTEATEAWSDDVLDRIAIAAARVAVRKITSATQQWVAGGFQNGEKLFVDSFNSFLREAGDQALRQGLNEILTPLKEQDYNPVAEGDGAPLRADDLPQWIKDYLVNTYNLESHLSTKFQKFVTGIGHEEIGDLCGGSIENCKNSPAFVNANMSGCPSGNRWPLDFPCRMQLTKWTVTVGLRNGDVLTFNTRGFNSVADVIPDPQDPSNIIPLTVVPGVPLNANGGTSGAVPKPIEVGSYDRGELNPFGKAITQTVVTAYHSTLAGTIENTMKEELGPQWLDYATDITVGYNSVDPYSAFELILKPGNNLIGTAYTTGNRIANQADKALASAVTEVTSSGFLADKACEISKEEKYADGTVEDICKVFSSKNPAGLVGDQVGESVKQAFDIKNATKWEQVGIELLAEAADAVITGGLELAAGEIRNKSAEVSTQIKQLGPISYLFGKAADGLNLSDDQSWQLLSSREVDFSDINFQINLTSQGAVASVQTRNAIDALAAPTMVLDQECVFGPDFGWEQRLRENFAEDVDRLRTIVQENAADENPNDSERARKNFLEYLEDELEKQISWVYEAMPSNPFPLQQQLMGTVDAIPRELQKVSTYSDAAEAKKDAADALVTVRNLIKEVPGGSILLQKPPVWQDDIDGALNELSEFGGSGVTDAEVSRAELLTSLSELDGGAPTGLEGFPTITLAKPTLFLPVQPTSTPFDVTQGLYGFDKEDGDITDDITVSIFNVSLGTPVSGTIIDLQDTYTVTPGTTSTPAVTAGMQYRVTYSLEDSNSNQAVDRVRTIQVKTYNDYLDDLSNFNQQFTTFLTNIANQPIGIRSRLSQAVNLYLGVEKNISTENSLNDTRATREVAEQRLDSIYTLLDECWLTLYQLDKLIDPEDFPGVRDGSNLLKPDSTVASDPVADGVLASGYQDEWDDFMEIVEVREDARIPYINRALPYKLSRGKNTPTSTLSAVDVLLFPHKLAFEAIFGGSNNTSNLGALIKNSVIPDIRYENVPDFQCALDAQKLIDLDTICNQNNACTRSIIDTYEKYHCISANRDLDPRNNEATVVTRKNKGGDNTRIRDAYVPGRHTIGVIEEVHNLAYPPGNQNSPVCNPNASTNFKSRVLKSPIDDCKYWRGTLIHRVPPVSDSIIQNGVSYGQSAVKAFIDEWVNPQTYNYNLPVQFSGFKPSPTSTDRTWISGVMHSFDVYADHTSGILYCNPNSVLFNTLHNFNEKWGVQKDGEKDNWWDGEFEADLVTPKTAKVGYKYWSNIQRCDDWTKSDLSAYTEFPKVEL